VASAWDWSRRSWRTADEPATRRILAELGPDILALNAGATPAMGPLDQLSWADSLRFGNMTSRPVSIGCRLRSTSRSSREAGSSLYRAARQKTDRQCRGGYGGAKRMLWFMAKYANGVSEKKRLGIAFRRSCRSRCSWGTGVGDAVLVNGKRVELSATASPPSTRPNSGNTTEYDAEFLLVAAA
jgi:hypothetical protein